MTHRRCIPGHVLSAMTALCTARCSFALPHEREQAAVAAVAFLLGWAFDLEVRS